jgi:hypothetical protein
MELVPKETRIGRVVAACVAGVAVGFVLIALPSLIRWEHPKSLFDFVDAAVKGMSVAHLLLLVLGGLFWGFFLRWPYALCAAYCQLGSLPIIAVLEMLRDPTSHNLWPFEFMIYLVLAVASVLAAAAGLMVRKLMAVGSAEKP